MWVLRRAWFVRPGCERRQETFMEPCESQNTFPIIPLTDLVPDLSRCKSFTAYNEQRQSLFFAMLPPELRRLVFGFALAHDNDTDIYYGYQQNMFSCHPCTNRPIKLRTGLLSTCQKAYEEAWPFVITNPVPPTYQPLQIFEINVWAKLFWFAHGGLRQTFSNNFAPSIITLNIRHWDWYGWDTAAPLIIQKSWIDNDCYELPQSCKKLNIRFQTIESNQSQLETIIRNITLGSSSGPPWTFRRADSLEMVPVINDETPCYELIQYPSLNMELEKNLDRLKFFSAFVTWKVLQNT